LQKSYDTWYVAQRDIIETKTEEEATTTTPDLQDNRTTLNNQL